MNLYEMQTEIDRLKAENATLRENEEMAGGCLNMIHERLKRLGCSHDSNAHDATPPMMYDDWISCVVAHHVEQATAKLQAENAGLREEGDHDIEVMAGEQVYGLALQQEVERLKAEVVRLNTAAEVSACKEDELATENEELHQVLRGGPDVQDGPEGVGVLAPNLEMLAGLFEDGTLRLVSPFDAAGMFRKQAKLIREALRNKS